MKYIDTSAFVKYYGNPKFEKGVLQMSDLFENAKSGKEILITSIFTIGEIISVFDRWVRIKAITNEDFIKILIRLVSDLEELINLKSLVVDGINSEMVSHSFEYIPKYHISINDSLHLYTALSNKNIKEFFSSDENLNKAATNEGLDVINPDH